MRKNVHAKNENGLAKYQFTRETIDVCSCGVYNGMLGSFAPLEEVTQGSQLGRGSFLWITY